MSDYISRSALYEKTAEWEAQALHMVELHLHDEDTTEWRKWSTILAERSTFKYDVADAPPADVVPVVRCKDCKYYEEHHYELEGEPPYIKGKCGNKFGLNRQYMVHPEEFCSRGERRE